jgi:hypothetical protein
MSSRPWGVSRRLLQDAILSGESSSPTKAPIVCAMPSAVRESVAVARLSSLLGGDRGAGGRGFLAPPWALIVGQPGELGAGC